MSSATSYRQPKKKQSLERNGRSSTCLNSCGAFMESCPTSGCAMGIAKETTVQVDRDASLSICMETGSESTRWGGQIDTALEAVTSTGAHVTEADTAVAPGVESSLREEWPVQQSSDCKKRGWEAAESKPPSKKVKKQAEETDRWEACAVEFQTSTAMAVTHPEDVSAAIPLRPKPARGRKPKKKAEVGKGPPPQEPRVQGEVPGPLENGPSLPVKVPKKRGRKSKAELLLLKLSQGLECQSTEPLQPQKSPASDESQDCLATTPGGRPKRRAAKVALLYLQELAEELTSVCQPPTQGTSEPPLVPQEPSKKRRGRKPHEQKLENEDVDFVPSEEGLLQAAEEEEEEENDLLLSEVSEPEPEQSLRGPVRPKAQFRGFASNGLHNSVMAPVWKSLRVTHRLREQLHSHWEFPEWVPSARKWTFLSESEMSEYLPGETKSPLFSIKREGLQEDSSILYRINRFNALQPHEERLDMTFFVGGPIWAMEWCPAPEGSMASQFVAISCNQGMDERHSLAGVHTGSALLQLWELGPIQPDMGSATKPRLAYAIATRHGCIWDMKFCPSGAWELPATRHKSFQMSRLGLLAVAFSDGKVLLYSLPHAQDLHAYRRAQVTDGPSPRHAICKVQCVATLQVGSIQAPSPSECGQCFSLAWMPTKPHHQLAAGFYDGTVALWNLTSKSLLQRIRQPDGSLKLYPFHCFLAHDHAVRNIQWCKANSNFMVTAGNDRKIKFWDLRRLHEPINSIKRFLSTEIAWLLPYSGITVAQDNCYASYGLCGIHYLDAGYLGFRAYFVAPRKGTVWSISGSDWLNSIAAGDATGELVAAMMPDLSVNPHNVKRPSERRFPVYKAELLPCGPISIDARTGASEKPLVEGRTYSESVARNYIHFQDTDLRSFFRRKPRKPTLGKEAKEGDGLGRLQLEAVHKVRFSPNLDCHSWLVSGGQSGIVRVHCISALASPPSRKLLLECQAQFSAMFQAEGQADGPGGDPTMLYTAVS
ncbi:general transcription factor 3C polypeptide 2 isoform X1 [Sphaerodactylus townsendi]|uniref:general transcription factor 3C polypeptide 2 isoform X1 n=2 Tax=Sphaerodactylus townsendi TaxID=933632 RepID=UPI00202730C9|nr:general transcription factor 3C polypeptide 2 isoform X1 [Sphaerodactylus townsendi]